MLYASWLPSEFNAELEVRKQSYSSGYAEIIDRVLSRENESDFEKVLIGFDKNGYDSFNLDFIEKLCTSLFVATQREKHTRVERSVFKQKLNEAIDGIDSLSGALYELDLDRPLMNMLSTMFPGVKAKLRVGTGWSLLDLLSYERDRLEYIKDEEPLDPSPGGSELISNRVYFVRRLSLDFLYYFGETMPAAITRLTKIVLADDVDETTVAGIISRYKLKNSLRFQSMQTHEGAGFFPMKT